MDDFEMLAQRKEFERFQQAIGEEDDPIMVVLRAHLYSENLLERLINFKLPRGDKVIENGNLTYHQKLVLVEALECLPDSFVSSLRNLNKLRNQCAHALHKKITDGDITKFGSPLGKEFTKLKRSANLDEAVLMRSVVVYVCGFVASTCVSIEHPEIVQPKQPAKPPRITSSSTRTTRKRVAD